MPARKKTFKKKPRMNYKYGERARLICDFMTLPKGIYNVIKTEDGIIYLTDSKYIGKFGISQSFRVILEYVSVRNKSETITIEEVEKYCRDLVWRKFK